MAVIGLKDLHYAVITEENNEATTYGEVKPFGPAIALTLSPSINRANLRADDGVLFSEASKGPTAVSVNTAYLDKAVEAEILGKTVHANGFVTDNVDDNPPYIAIGGMAKNARGGYDYFWLYRVKLAPGETAMNTKEETPTFQTPTLSGESVARLHDGEEKLRVWSEDPTITDKSVFGKWFTEVIDKDYAPTV